jgi:class 3 adenylate cyclase
MLCLQWIHFRASRSSRRLPDLLWQQKKRLAGAPKSGDLAVVVTDIQDFTRLTQEAPDAMVQVVCNRGLVGTA